MILGQRVIPLEKVGLYVPGGTAAYPSTVLMDAIPAKIAGVEEIVMVTPPNKEGSVNPYILAAAHVGLSCAFPEKPSFVRCVSHAKLATCCYD